MRVALFQQDVLLSDPVGNREKIASVLSHQHDCDLFILPEMFTTGFCTKKQNGMIVCDDGETLPWIIQMAATGNFLSVWPGALVHTLR